MQTFRSIQYLRGLAALSVVLFHVSGYVAGYGSGSMSLKSFKVGEAGVDVFFIISGFVLTLAAQNPQGRTTFIMGRLLRVGVPYWIVTLFITAVALALPSAFQSLDWSARDAALSFLFVPSMVKHGGLFPLLEPGWTLALEMLFYALLAVSIGWRSSSRSAFIIICLASLALVGVFFRPEAGAAWFYTQPVLIEFAAGMGLAYLVLADRRFPVFFAWLLVSLSLGGFAVADNLDIDPFGALRPVAYGLPALALVAGAVFIEQTGSLRHHRWLAFLGDISYSLYLTHVLVLGIVARIGSRFFTGLSRDAVLLGAMIIGSLLVSAIFHRLVERPAFALAKSLSKNTARSGETKKPAQRPAFPGI